MLPKLHGERCNHVDGDGLHFKPRDEEIQEFQGQAEAPTEILMRLEPKDRDDDGEGPSGEFNPYYNWALGREPYLVDWTYHPEDREEKLKVKLEIPK